MGKRSNGYTKRAGDPEKERIGQRNRLALKIAIPIAATLIVVLWMNL